VIRFQASRYSKPGDVDVPEEIADKLKELSARTEIPQSRLLRQALELLFAKYDETLRPTKQVKPRK
jgi:predicted DNA-binding protein